MTVRKYDAVVIGAGHNGLVTSAYLAKAGLSVLVLERLDKVGGACTTDEIFPGLYGPMCARLSHMLQGKIVDDLGLHSYGFEIADPPPGVGIGRRFRPFPDGTFLGGPHIRDTYDFANQIRGISERDASAYFKWEEFWEHAPSIFYPFFLTEPPTVSDLVHHVRGTRLEEILEKLLTWSVLDLLDEHFEHPHVRAQFIGLPESDPRSPGSLLWTAISRCNRFGRPEDRGTPLGNMGSITRAMAASAKDMGVEIRLGAAVDSVLVDAGVATGVQLSDGSQIQAGVVVSNADPKRTFSKLVAPEDAPQDSRKARLMKSTVSSLHLFTSLSELPDFSHWLGDGYRRESVVDPYIAPSVEYIVESWDDCQSKRWSRHPLISIQIPSLLDPSLAPRGGHIACAWIMYEPPSLEDGTWDDAREDAAGFVIDMIDEYAPGFRDSIVDWSLQTPLDFENRVGLTNGNIHHIDDSADQLLAGRMPYRTQIDGLYLCGAGTHPGGEVSGAPGHNAAQAILRDLGR